jgi:hypothetical protein
MAKDITAARLLAALDRDPALKAEVTKALAAGQTRHLVLCQDWEESERGWGVRPDGYTLHLTRVDWADFVTGYNNTFNDERTVPDEYTRVNGQPRIVELDKEVYQKLLAHRKNTDHKHPFQAQGLWGEGRTGPKGYDL